MGTHNYIIKVVVEEDFGIRRVYYSNSTYSLDIPYLSPLQNDRTCIIDEALFLEESFWTPVKYFINNFDVNRYIDIDIFKNFLNNIEYDVDDLEYGCDKFNIKIRNWFNDYDLTHISWDGVRLSFYYNSSPMTCIDIVFDNGKLEILIYPKNGSMMYGIRETDWDDFVVYLKGDLDISKHRDMVIDDILSNRKVDNTLDPNLIRRLKYHALLSRDNGFIKSVYDYYLKYDKLSPKQIESISKIII